MPVIYSVLHRELSENANANSFWKLNRPRGKHQTETADVNSARDLNY